MSIQIHSLKNFFRSSMALLFDPVKKQLEHTRDRKNPNTR